MNTNKKAEVTTSSTSNKIIVDDTNSNPDSMTPSNSGNSGDNVKVGLEEKPMINGNPQVVVSHDPLVAPVKEFTVSGQNFSFTPNVINVNKGDNVRIIFKNTAGMHNLKIDEFNVQSQTTKSPSQEILEFTADKTGSFQYYCSVGNHRAMGMFGTLNVK